MPSNDDLLFADHAVKAGFVSREQADASLEVQRRMEEMGVKDSLRNVMVNRGVLREADAVLVAKAAGVGGGRDPIPGFALEARIGTGAMGSVYRALQKGMQRHVAVKILRRDLTSDARQVERLRREATLVGKLDHPNIVRGLDSGETNGLVWFAMEFVDGETLRQKIARQGRIAPDEAVKIARQLAEALEHAHSQGVVHRDIKPGNVLLTKQGEPRLSDYGLAKGQTDDALTQIDATLGTPQYVAPEQARNPRDADIRSDVYSLGATLYTMLCGRPPFEGETLAQTLTKVLYERPKPLSDLVPDLPEAVGYVVERMMAKDRRHRYATPTALLHDLRALEAGRLRVPSGFAGDIAQFEERRRSRRLWFGGAATVAAAIGAAFVALWWDARTQAEGRAEEARNYLTDTRSRPGAQANWDGRTIQEMVRRLEFVRGHFAGTAAADEAQEDLARWQHQQRQLVRVQQFALTDGGDGDWPKRIAELADLQRELAKDADATVALRQAGETLEALRRRRDGRAGAEVAALEEAPAATLAESRARWASLADALRRRYYGSEASAHVRHADEVAAGFDRAATHLEQAFVPWTAAAARGGALSRGAFSEAADALHAVDAALAEDTELRELLDALPPAGKWARVDDDRRAAAGRLLAETAAQALTALQDDVRRLVDRKAYQEALDKVAAFEPRSLPDQADALGELRARVETEIKAERDGTQDATAAAADRFFNAYGSYDRVRASQVLDEFERLLDRAPVADAAARRFLVGARRLTDLTESKLWQPFREGVSAYATAGGDLMDRTRGIHYRGITSVRIVGQDDLTFRYGGDQTWTGPISNIALDDVLRAGDVRYDTDPEAALVVAGLRISQFRPDPRDLRGSLAALDATIQLLQTARRAPDSDAVVERLSTLRADKVREAQTAIDKAEREAETRHEEARGDLDAGRPDRAAARLRELLELAYLRQTAYVLRRRDEIRQQLDRAERLRQTQGVASRFPGARFTERTDGTADLVWDFDDGSLEDPAARAVLGIVDGRVRVAFRLLVATDRPARQDVRRAAIPLRADHVIEWLPADSAGGPRNAPLKVDCPFNPRKRIDVSFTVRSERPFFLAASVCGVAAGVLSASDSLWGGRGVHIWNATDLDQADRAFPEATRATWQERNPDALAKDADTRFFQFEAGRVHRVRIVKDEGRTQLWVDGRLRADAPVTFKTQAGPLQDKVVIATWGPLDMDDLRITGTLDPTWTRRR